MSNEHSAGSDRDQLFKNFVKQQLGERGITILTNISLLFLLSIAFIMMIIVGLGMSLFKMNRHCCKKRRQKRKDIKKET